MARGYKMTRHNVAVTGPRGCRFYHFSVAVTDRAAAVEAQQVWEYRIGAAAVVTSWARRA